MLNQSQIFPVGYQYMQPIQSMPQTTPQPLPQVQTVQQQQPAQPVQQTPLTWVQGDAGARGFAVGPGQTVLLMDSESNQFFIKAADASGIPQPLRVFKYEEITPGRTVPGPQTNTPEDHTEYITREEFEKAIQEIREEAQADG